MKKWMSILVAALLVLSMTTAFAAVPSKTTSNATTVTAVVTTTGVAVAEDFKVEVVVEESAPVVQEITKIATFVAENSAPVVEYFPVEVKEQIVAKLPETVVTEEVEINEFVTIDQTAYTETYGDVKTSFSFTTVYAPEQTLVALVGIFTGEVDENGEPIIEWIVLDAIANEDGTVEVTFTQDAMLKMQSAEATSLAIINTPAVETEAAAE